jgi:hypothetical protein
LELVITIVVVVEEVAYWVVEFWRKNQKFEELCCYLCC